MNISYLQFLVLPSGCPIDQVPSVRFAKIQHPNNVLKHMVSHSIDIKSLVFLS